MSPYRRNSPPPPQPEIPTPPKKLKFIRIENQGEVHIRDGFSELREQLNKQQEEMAMMRHEIHRFQKTVLGLAVLFLLLMTHGILLQALNR